MRQDVTRTLAIILAAAIVAGCGIAKEEVGAVVGAGLGGLAGSLIGDGGGKLVAIGVGTMLGAIIGGETGKSLDRADRLAMQQATYEALEYGESGPLQHLDESRYWQFRGDRSAAGCSAG